MTRGLEPALVTSRSARDLCQGKPNYRGPVAESEEDDMARIRVITHHPTPNRAPKLKMIENAPGAINFENAPPLIENELS